jgi:hypothetical protein
MALCKQANLPLLNKQNSVFMKKQFLSIAFLSFGLMSCDKGGDNNNNSINTNTTEKKGSFSIDGVSYSGKSSIQTFVNNNYSILCEQDEPYMVLQVTFNSKEDAETGGTFVVEDDVINTKKGEVSISIDGLTYQNDGAQSITVSGKKISINNVMLKQTGTGAKKKTINSASIDF